MGSREEDSSNLQIFSPPYLFKGARPTITSLSPGSIGYGQSFEVGTGDANSIGSVALLRPSATTHLNDMGQLYIPLAFTASGTMLLNVSAPPDANLAPPGYYMLFILNENGVPSVASFVQLSGTVDLCPLDIDSSGSVNVQDLIALIGCFGEPSVPGCEPEDVNGDGTVNVLDLIELLMAFGTSCP